MRSVGRSNMGAPGTGDDGSPYEETKSHEAEQAEIERRQAMEQRVSFLEGELIRVERELEFRIEAIWKELENED